MPQAVCLPDWTPDGLLAAGQDGDGDRGAQEGGPRPGGLGGWEGWGAGRLQHRADTGIFLCAAQAPGSQACVHISCLRPELPRPTTSRNSLPTRPPLAQPCVATPEPTMQHPPLPTPPLPHRLAPHCPPTCTSVPAALANATQPLACHPTTHPATPVPAWPADTCLTPPLGSPPPPPAVQSLQAPDDLGPQLAAARSALALSQMGCAQERAVAGQLRVMLAGVQGTVELHRWGRGAWWCVGVQARENGARRAGGGAENSEATQGRGRRLRAMLEGLRRAGHSSAATGGYLPSRAVPMTVPMCKCSNVPLVVQECCAVLWRMQEEGGGGGGGGRPSQPAVCGGTGPGKRKHGECLGGVGQGIVGLGRTACTNAGSHVCVITGVKAQTLPGRECGE